METVEQVFRAILTVGTVLAAFIAVRAWLDIQRHDRKD